MRTQLSILVIGGLLAACTSGSSPGTSSSAPAALATRPAPASATPTRTATPAHTATATENATPARTATPTGSATATAPVLAGPRWVRLPDQAAFASSIVTAIAGGPDRYVAVGRTNLDAGKGTGMAWTSRDGVTWRRASAPPSVEGLIRDGAGYVGWGGSSVWTSPDGDAWHHAGDLPTTGFLSEVIGIARLGGALVAVGYEEVTTGDDVVEEIRTWTSPNGRAWTLVDPLLPAGWDGRVNAVMAAPGMLVAWGAARGPTGDVGVTLRSTDGRRWELGGAGLATGGDLREGIWSMAAGGGHLVAVGHGLSGEAGSPPPTLAAWTSGDGLSWTPARFEPGPPTGWTGLVRWDGSRFVALGASATWLSPDGVAWKPVDSVPDWARDGEDECSGPPCYRTTVLDMAAGPAGLVAIGSTVTDSGVERAVLWFAPAVTAGEPAP